MVKNNVNPYPNEFGTEIESTILTGPYIPDLPSYDIRKALKERRRLGRPLTGKEMEKFRTELNDPPKLVHRSTKLYPLPANQRALLL